MNEEDNVMPSWEILTLESAYEPRKPTEYVVDSILATYGLYVFFGPPGSMKSMILADLCAHVVSGADWLPGSNPDGTGIAVMKSPIMWIDMDNGQRRTDARFEAIGRANELPIDAPFYYVSMPDPTLIAHDFESMALLRDYIMQFGAKLVVIDNLGLITGEIEENNPLMATVMGNLRRISERTGCALVVIHHQRKGGAAGGRAGEALRGHSSIEAAIDAAIQITREKDSDEIMMRSTKSRDVPIQPMGARFNYVHKFGTNDLERAWFDGVAFRRGENALHDAIIENVEFYEQIGKTKLAHKVKDELGVDAPGINRIRAEIDDMLAKCQLQEKQDGKYRLITL